MSRRRRNHHPRRTELARERGFRTYYEQSKAPKRIIGPFTLGQLPAQAQRMRDAALKALGMMRREGLDLGTASRRAGIPKHVITHYGREALTGTGGRARALRSDRLYRQLWIISGGQKVVVDVRGSRQASIVGEYWNAMQRYVEGDDEALAPFRGKAVGGYELETDPDVLDELARRGDLSFEDIYRVAA